MVPFRHYPLTCSACEEPLLELIAATGNDEVAHRYRATCCFCGDRSFPVEVLGTRISVVATDKVALETSWTDGNETTLTTLKQEVPRCIVQ
jgi:hypothetical protein